MLKCELIGNLGADAEIKRANGSEFVTMRIANTERYKQEDGSVKESTDWVDVTWNQTESKVLPYLKAGAKVFIRGHLSLRVYSSKKDRCMKAGARIAATELELMDGRNDDVPRQIIDPDNGLLYDVSKHYWINYDTKKMKNDDVKLFVDKRGREYGMNKAGFVAPVPEEYQNSEEESQQNAENQ